MNSFYEWQRSANHNIHPIIFPTNCKPHYHQAIEILYTPEHDVDTNVNGETRILHPGEICVADCYDVHSFDSHDKMVIIIVIPQEYLSDYLTIRGTKRLATPYITDPELCNDIAQTMDNLINKATSTLLEKGYVNVLMGLILKGCNLSSHGNENISLMQNVLNFIENNYTDEINLDFLSSKFGYSKYYFSRMFNDFFKYSLKEHLAQVRLRNFVSKMQKDKNADIQDTALNCGFNSFQTFYRLFKKVYGKPPKEYLNN